MVKEFGNSTNNSSDGGLGRYENAGPSTAPSKDAGANSTDNGDDEEDPDEDPEDEADGTKTPSRV